MFYCDECAARKGWPTTILSTSYGPCEVCQKRRECNDVPSKYLPIPRPEPDPEKTE